MEQIFLSNLDLMEIFNKSVKGISFRRDLQGSFKGRVTKDNNISRYELTCMIVLLLA